MALNINYIAQLSPLVHSGGGELIMRRLIETGEKRGHRFAFATASPRAEKLFINPDLTILTDVFNSPYTLRRLSPSLLERVLAQGRFIHFDNAYVDTCNLDYLPCQGSKSVYCQQKLGLSPLKRLLSRDFSGHCFQEKPLVKALYQRSLCNVFLSPLHHRVISKMLGLEGKDAIIVKPLIDEGLFYDRRMERDLEYLFVGVIGEAKGLAEMRLRFGDRNIHFVGKIAKGERLDFGTYLGAVPYAEIPVYMNRARNFVFLPRWPEPQGRVVVEAAMCGCHLICNDNVGALSFDFSVACPEHYRNADAEFWQELENRMARQPCTG